MTLSRCRNVSSPPKGWTLNSTERPSAARSRVGKASIPAAAGPPVYYGDSPWAIFVRPESKIRKPEDLKDVPVSVGIRAGSHFNVPYRLEKYLPLKHIKTVNTGGFGARQKALLDGEVEAASLLPPQIAMAEQLGLRRIIEDRFKTLWWVPDSAIRQRVTAARRVQ